MDAGAAGEGEHFELTNSYARRGIRGSGHRMPCRRGLVPDSTSRRSGNQTTYLPPRIAQQFHGAAAQRGRIESDAGAVAAQDRVHAVETTKLRYLTWDSREVGNLRLR